AASPTTSMRPAGSLRNPLAVLLHPGYGLELWNHAETSPITIEDVEEVREIVTDSLAANFFGTRFQIASESAQRYLAATASLRAAPRSADVARSYGAKDQR